jgi:hypothetical protein
VQALPLTALNDALRGVMLDGTGLGAIGPELLLLADGFRQLPIALRPDSSTLTASLRQSACP